MYVRNVIHVAAGGQQVIAVQHACLGDKLILPKVWRSCVQVTAVFNFSKKITSKQYTYKRATKEYSLK